MMTILAIASASMMAAAEVEQNKSDSGGGGLVWPTAKNEGDLLLPPDEEEEEEDYFDDEGGFPSLDGMLQWAIGHSDPSKLKQASQDVQHLSPHHLNKRQVELKELMERLKMPSDAQLMQVAIDDLNNLTLTMEDHYRALQELLELVESLDNANDLHKLGGLSVVIRKLSNPEPDIRMISAWILGTACQNNPVVQKQILELGGLKFLMKMVSSGFPEEATKAMFALSALIRNNLAGRELFYAESGDLMLQDMLSNSSNDIRLLKKSLFLVADLVESHLEIGDKAEPPFFSNHLFLKSVVDLLASSDFDLQEKALVAIKNLLQLRRTKALAFKDLCGLERALERVRQQLQHLAEDEYRRDYARDVESIVSEVEFIFQEKLIEVSGDVLTEVPT